MGKVIPEIASGGGAQSFGVPTFLLEILEHQVLPDRFHSLVIRNVLVGLALLLLALILLLLVRARRRYLGYQQAPLPLDYHRQRELLRGIDADQ
jgi:hypothetical protein